MRSNQKVYWIALVVFLGLIFALMYAMSSPVRKARKADQFDAARVVWSAKSGSPVPDDFLYVFYPRDAKVAIVDDEGMEIGVHLDRAFWCSDETDWRRAEVKSEPLSATACRVTLMRINNQGDTEYFVYIVDGDKLTPEEMRSFRTPSHQS